MYGIMFDNVTKQIIINLLERLDIKLLRCIKIAHFHATYRKFFCREKKEMKEKLFLNL